MATYFVNSTLERASSRSTASSNATMQNQMKTRFEGLSPTVRRRQMDGALLSPVRALTWSGRRSCMNFVVAFGDPNGTIGWQIL